MAKPKTSPKSYMQTMQEEAQARRKEIKELPLVGERWWVEEKWPDRKVSNEYDYNIETIKGKTINASGYKKTEQECLDYIDLYEPDDAKGAFIIRHQFCRTHTKVWNEWGWL